MHIDIRASIVASFLQLVLLLRLQQLWAIVIVYFDSCVYRELKASV